LNGCDHKEMTKIRYDFCQLLRTTEGIVKNKPPRTEFDPDVAFPVRDICATVGLTQTMKRKPSQQKIPLQGSDITQLSSYRSEEISASSASGGLYRLVVFFLKVLFPPPP
jgi:hypothetical protein